MIEQIKFVLGWVKYNKFIIFVFLSVLSLIVCSNIFLIQFFYESSMKDDDGKYYYAYFFDDDVDIDVIDEILEDISNENIKVIELLAASNSDEISARNEYQISSYLIVNEQENEERNQYLSYGKFNGAPQSYIAEWGMENLVLGGLPFECVGEGAIHIGTCFSDYLIEATDYRKYIQSVDAVEFTLYEKNGKKLKAIIDEYITSYEAEYFEDLLKSGVESVKDTAIMCFLLLLFSLYSALVFVEVIMHMQSMDIAVFRRCGATKADIRRIYLVQAAIGGVVSFVIGVVLCNLLLLFINFNFNNISAITYFITFVIFMFCYIFEVLLYIRITLNYTGSMVDKEC